MAKTQVNYRKIATGVAIIILFIIIVSYLMPPRSDNEHFELVGGALYTMISPTGIISRQNDKLIHHLFEIKGINNKGEIEYKQLDPSSVDVLKFEFEAVDDMAYIKVNDKYVYLNANNEFILDSTNKTKFNIMETGEENAVFFETENKMYIASAPDDASKLTVISDSAKSLPFLLLQVA